MKRQNEEIFIFANGSLNQPLQLKAKNDEAVK